MRFLFQSPYIHKTTNRMHFFSTWFPHKCIQNINEKVLIVILNIQHSIKAINAIIKSFLAHWIRRWSEIKTPLNGQTTLEGQLCGILKYTTAFTQVVTVKISQLFPYITSALLWGLLRISIHRCLTKQLSFAKYLYAMCRCACA